MVLEENVKLLNLCLAQTFLQACNQENVEPKWNWKLLNAESFPGFRTAPLYRELELIAKVEIPNTTRRDLSVSKNKQ